jgi:hypothetical protein
MTLGKDTFGLNKTEFSDKIGRIIKNFRAGSKLIGEPRDFVLRCCKLTERWCKLANDENVLIYLRNVETAGGRRVKMIALERGGTSQPVPKAQLVSALYPTKRIATSATPEEKHFNAVRASMRFAVTYQLRAFRDSCHLPIICHITGKKIIPGARADVDHVGKTFSELCDDFIREKCLNYSCILLCGPPTAKRFKDTALWESWIYYHLQHARFALALASGNRSKGADGYNTDASLIGSFKSDDPDSLSLDF